MGVNRANTGSSYCNHHQWRYIPLYNRSEKGQNKCIIWISCTMYTKIIIFAQFFWQINPQELIDFFILAEASWELSRSPKISPSLRVVFAVEQSWFQGLGDVFEIFILGFLSPFFLLWFDMIFSLRMVTYTCAGLNLNRICISSILKFYLFWFVDLRLFKGFFFLLAYPIAHCPLRHIFRLRIFSHRLPSWDDLFHIGVFLSGMCHTFS